MASPVMILKEVESGSFEIEIPNLSTSSTIMDQFRRGIANDQHVQFYDIFTLKADDYGWYEYIGEAKVYHQPKITPVPRK